MKLKNKTKGVREIMNSNGWKSLVGPGETIEIERPLLNRSTLNSFKIIKEDIDINEKGGNDINGTSN